VIKSLFNYLMKNKITVFFLILSIVTTVSNVIEKQEEKYILNNYELVNHIVINTNNKELVITDNKELEKYKRNLEVKMYIDDSLLLTENIYLLNNDTKTEFFLKLMILSI